MTMYAKITGGLVEQFPYSVAKLKADNPETGFPKAMTAEDLAREGVYPVIGRAAPDTGPYEVAYHTGQAVQVDGEWQREWAIKDMFADTTDGDGVKTTKAEHEVAFEEDKLNRKRQGMSCSKMQGILTLGQTAWGEVQTYRETASWAEQMVIDSAQDWNRTSENIAFFGYLLNYTDAQMDTMFTAAALVKA
jgi:hypothetical protein